MIDEVDLKILRVMQFNARIANVDLADQIGLSPTPCWNRVKALEEGGVINSYVTIINQAVLGFPDTVVIEISLERHSGVSFEQFEAALAKLPQVVEVSLLTGDYDYLIRVSVAGAAGCDRFLTENLHKLPGIKHARSSFVLRQIKQTYSLEIGAGQKVATDRREPPRPKRRKSAAK